MRRIDDPDSPQPERPRFSDEDRKMLRDPGRLFDRFLFQLLFFEGVLGLIGVAAGMWSGLAWGPMIRPNGGVLLVGVMGGLGLFGLHLLLLLPGGERNPFYRFVFRPLWDAFLSRLPNFGLLAIVLMAALSGVAEEILFRGWLQTQGGIVVASILFGICHIWGKDGIPYGLYAIGMGFVLGLLFEHTGQNLWAPVLAHGINNLLGFLALKYNSLLGFMP